MSGKGPHGLMRLVVPGLRCEQAGGSDAALAKPSMPHAAGIPTSWYLPLSFSAGKIQLKICLYCFKGLLLSSQTPLISNSLFAIC